MKPKPSEVLSVEPFTLDVPNEDGFFIGPCGKENDFKTKEDAHAWLNELDRVAEYKKENKAFKALISRIYHQHGADPEIIEDIDQTLKQLEQ